MITEIKKDVQRDEKAEKEVRNLLLKLRDDGGWHLANGYNASSDGQISRVTGGGCHGSLRAVINPGALGAEATAAPEDHERFDRWWDWCTDKDKSPWKALMQDGIELVRHANGNPAGWIIPKSTCLRVPFSFQKNFCIHTRSFQESYHRWVLWDQLVQEYKMDKLDAYYFVAVMYPANMGTARKPFRTENLTVSDARSGGHWAMTDTSEKFHSYFTARVNWKVLRTGDIDLDVNKSGKSVNQVQINAYFMWPKPENSYENWKPDAAVMAAQNQKGRFSTSKLISIPIALDAFYKWQDEQGILK